MSEQKQIIVFPRGQLTELDKARLDESGILAIEADNPKDVVSLIPMSTIICADDFLMALLEGVTEERNSMCKFVHALNTRLKLREKSAHERTQ